MHFGKRKGLGYARYPLIGDLLMGLRVSLFFLFEYLIEYLILVREFLVSECLIFAWAGGHINFYIGIFLWRIRSLCVFRLLLFYLLCFLHFLQGLFPFNRHLWQFWRPPIYESYFFKLILILNAVFIF